MDHQLIEEQNIAALYAAGQLGPEDEERFEEHLIECRECRERVAWADDLRTSLQALAAEDTAQAARLGLLAWLLAWLAGHRRAAGLGLVAALLFLLALPGWLLIEQGKLRRELAAARATAAHPTPAATPTPPDQITAEPGRPAAREKSLEQELAAAQARGEDLARRLAVLTRPQVNTALYSLGLVRGEGSANQVLVGRTPEWVVLSIDLPDSPAASYQATLIDARGRTVWQGEGLRPTANDTLVLAVYSDLLPPGPYRLVLTGPPASPPTEIPFQVARRP
jgi:hypothetical protein